MKKNIIVVVFYICLVIIIITSFRKNKNENDSEKITYSQIEQADVKVKNNSERTRKVLHIKGDVSKICHLLFILQRLTDIFLISVI